MKKLYLIGLLLFQLAVFSQEGSKTYILHLRGEAQDTLVYEMELHTDNTFANRQYSKKITDTTSNYKKWDVVTRKGTFAKDKGYVRLTQMEGDQCLNGALMKIVFQQIWFYYTREKDGKLRRCYPTTYHKVHN